VLLLGALLWLLGPTMGFRHTRASIRERLGGQIITPHFIINHGSSINPDTLKLFSAQAEFHHEELTRWFHGAPRGRLTIWLFADSSQKRRLFGAENVEVAKTWLKEIYVTASMFPHHSLKHELAHIFAGIYGDSFFKASMSPLPLVGGLTLPWPNPGIIEGMAVAADFNKRDTTFHEKAKILYMFHLAAPMETVFSSAFYSLPASRAYTQAGSFVRFLYDTHGARKVFQLYREGGGWQRIFGKSLKALEQDYSDFIKTVTVDENMVTMTRALFSRRPLHRVRCAHQVAREIRRAQNQMARRSFSSALLTLERAMDYDPGSLDLKMFYLMAAREAKSFEKAEDAACTILAKASKNPLMQAQSQLVLAQMELTRDNPKKANSYLLKVEKLPMTRGTHREVTLMKVLIRCDKPLRDKLRAVIFSNLPYPKALADLTALGMRFPLAHYLAGSLALMSGRYAQSVEAFGRITPEALPDDEFRCAYYHRMTKAAVLARDQVTRDRWISELQNCPGGKISARFLGDFSRFIERTPCLPLWSVNAPIPR
ncbi:hypothetical protein KJ865_02220, partial [Myxococcota bacterium]|nr:hypothetical protein [Myxococcota bacterium]